MRRPSDTSRTSTPTPRAPARVRVLYDGNCAMCSNLTRRIAAGSARNAFYPQNLHEATLPDGVSRDAVGRELHVIDRDGVVIRGADAVFRLLEEYPRWRWLARIGRLGVLRPFTRIGYRFVAVNRDHIFGPAARLFWTKEVALIGLIAGLALSPRLWTGRRSYPLVPVYGIQAFDALEWLPITGLVGATVVALVLPRPRTALLAMLVMIAWLALADQTRWQPWFYQYSALTAVLAAWTWRSRDDDGVARRARDETLAASRAIVVGTYFWSGLNKVNVSYLGGASGWLIEPLSGRLPDPVVDTLVSLAPAVPALEMAIALGLLWPHTRNIAVAAAALMHVLILTLLGPWGHDWNSVVWPWNAAMIAIVSILFGGDRRTSARSLFAVPMSSARALAVAAFCIMPALGLLGLWDAYLSASLYARNLPDAAIVVTEGARDSLPEDIRSYVDDNGVLWPMTWALAEMNVPAYPAPRVYKALARAICSATAHAGGVTLRLGSRPDPLTGEIRVGSYTCDEL